MKKHLIDIERKFNLANKSELTLDLSQNERNFPLPEEFFNYFLKSINQRDIFFYPDVSTLKTKLATYHNIKVDNILLTPGSDIGIKTIFEAFDLKGKNIITTDYSFPMYKVYSDIYQAELRVVSYKDLKVDLSKILKLINKKTKFIILANPNSPIGDFYRYEQLVPLLDTGLPVVIDEAYIELTVYDSIVSKLHLHPNLIILRTMSKGFGAAGLRVGYVIANQEYSEILAKLRFMYEITSISAKYCEAVLDNINYFKLYAGKLLSEKTKAVGKFESKYEVIDTDTSWFFINNEVDNQDLINNLHKHKVGIRTIDLPHSDKRKNWIKVNYDLSLTDNCLQKYFLL